MANERIAGFTNTRLGMNSTTNPLLIAESQVARGINVVVRDSLPKTRPGFVQQAVTLPSGTFQGASVWSLNSGDRIAFVVSGVLYTLAVDTLTLTNLATTLDASAQCYFTQVERYLIVQNGVDAPTVVHEVAGVPQLYTDPVSVPTGYAGVFAHGRYHFVPRHIPNTAPAQEGRTSLVSGDVQILDEPETVLEATETEYLNEGGAHAMPLELGFIHGVGVYRNAATGTGNGEVIAFARNGLASFDFSLRRETEWKNQVLSRVLFQGPGCRSPWSVVNVNDDLLYMGYDGLRSVRYTMTNVGAHSGSLSNMPLSVEVEDLFDGLYLPYASIASANNRVFATIFGTGSPAFRGLASWDVAARYYAGANVAGVFDGFWTGATFRQVVTAQLNGVPQAYVFTDNLRLFRIDPAADADMLTDGTEIDIESRVITGAFNFGSFENAKELMYAEFVVTDVTRDTSFSVYYRPHGYPLWTLLGTKSLDVGVGSLPQTRRLLRIPLDTPGETCDPSTGKPLTSAFAFEFAIEWTGHAEITSFHVKAREWLNAPPVCDAETGVPVAPSATAGEALDDFSYVIEV